MRAVLLLCYALTDLTE